MSFIHGLNVRKSFVFCKPEYPLCAAAHSFTEKIGPLSVPTVTKPMAKPPVLKFGTVFQATYRRRFRRRADALNTTSFKYHKEVVSNV